MKKEHAQFRAKVYAGLIAGLPALAKEAAKGLKGPAAENAPRWQQEIEFELNRRIRRMAEKLEKITKAEAQ